MTTDGKSFCGSDEIDRLAKRLLGRRRILLWGEMGIGKSSLALQLLPQLGRQAGHCQLLELDPGSAPFGIPGTVCRAWLTPRGFDWGDCQALCSLDSARFRLPLVLAAGRLLAMAADGEERGPLLIDPPGVVRGVGGAELLTALAASCGIDAVVAIRRGEGGLPLAGRTRLPRRRPYPRRGIPRRPASRPAGTAEKPHRTVESLAAGEPGAGTRPGPPARARHPAAT